ncbi:MAG: dehydrogenase [Planctomycetota bacterium]|nr:MAG: dehydrogenase [Planctomycetota bacterium]
MLKLLVCRALPLVPFVLRAVLAHGAEPASLPTVPEGYTIEQVAAAPLVEHPTMAGFDDLGRLYVADSDGRNLPFDQLEKQLPGRIRMLEDTDGDGRFDRGTVFADKMTFPQGAVWFRGAVYVCSPPYVWRLEDSDDDGVADRRDKLVGTFGSNGNAADIHGCFVTPTGRIAWCDGRHGHEFKDAEGNTTSKGLAARVFTCLPDGSDVETFCGGGMDNPVEVAFTGEGEMIGTMTFYNPDAARHDALVHFIYGGVYPKKHPCTSEFKRTGELMPALSRFGVTAPSGLTHYDHPAWGDAFRGNFFSAHFNTHKILRHVLERTGATFSSRDEDFLVSQDVDFHPTDVLVDADGSLLVVDTGGWFRIGCPTSQIAKPEVKGAIYRIRRTDAEHLDDPRGLKIDWERTSDTEMADLLADPRPAVVERAIEFLVPRGDAAMGALATALFDETSYRTRQNAMWTLARIGSENARLLLRQGLSDDDVEGRIAAIKGVGDLCDAASILPLIALLRDNSPAVRREAATALGRLRDKQAVPALLKALPNAADRFEQHAITYAMIEIGDRQAALKGLDAEEPATRRGALIALTEMDSGDLSRELVAPLLDQADGPLLETLIAIYGQHPTWAADLHERLARWLGKEKPSKEEATLARGALVALLGEPAVQELAAKALSRETTSHIMRRTVLEAIVDSEAPLNEVLWQEPLRQALAAKDRDVVRQAIIAAEAVGAQGLVEPLSAVGLDAELSDELRVAALCAVAKTGAECSAAGFELLAAQFTRQAALRERLAAAEALGSFALTASQRTKLTRIVEKATPLEASWLLHAFENAGDVDTGLAVIEALDKSPARASITRARLMDALKHYPAEVRSAAAAWDDTTTDDGAQRAGRLAELVDLVGNGNADRGKATFFSQRAACSACHRVGEQGESIGPDLSQIGQVRSPRDLVEAIAFPSVSLARGYETYSVATADGQVHSGLISRETSTNVYLRTSERAEVRIPRDAIEEFVPSTVSTMPAGLDKVLSPSELADVVAFLSSLR